MKIDLSNLKVSFCPAPIDQTILKKLFLSVEAKVNQSDFDRILRYRPHPALVPVWPKLYLRDSLIGLATFYHPLLGSHKNLPVFICNFYINSKFQRKGIGTYLFRQIEAYCAHIGHTLFSLHPTKESKVFWQNMGFIKDSRYPTLLFKKI